MAADLRLGEMAYRKVHHPSVAEMENFGDFLTRELERFIDDNALDRDRLLGVGIALPAVIAPDESRRITLAPTLHLRDVELQRLMGTIPYPLYIENDATSGGYAEWFTHWQGRDIAYLLLETGVGGAILVNGGQYRGVNHRSGEFGHMCVEPGGCPVSAASAGAWRRIVPPPGSVMIWGSRSRSFSTAWNGMFRSMRRFGMICCGIWPSGSTIFGWPWIAMWCWAAF